MLEKSILMQKITFLTLLFFSILACSDKTEQKQVVTSSQDYEDDEIFPFLDFKDTLYMYFQDEKCGEWGGDVKCISVYKGRETSFLDISEIVMNCDSIDYYLDNPIKEIFLRKHVKLDDIKTKLVLDAMKELFDLVTYSQPQMLGNSGQVSVIRTSNEQICLSFYFSPEWHNFDKLYNLVKRENTRKNTK